MTSSIFLQTEKDLIICSEEITFEAHKNENGFYFIVHNNSDDRSILEYQELYISVDSKQLSALIKYLTVGKSDYSTELDKVIEEEMKNKPKDIMK